MQGFTTIDLIILIVYLAAVLFAGLFFSKKEMKGKEFFKGDGTIPWWVTSVSIFATLLSPISFLSLAGNSYAGTWIMWFAQLGMLVAIPITIKFFLPIYSKLDIDTAYHYLEIRFGSKGLRVLGAVMFIVYQVGRMSIIMYLPSMVLSKLTGLNVNLLIIAMGVIAIIYSYTGGLKSVLWTDFIQGSVLLVGVTFALFYLANGINGGFGAIFQTMGEGKFLAADQPIFNPNILKDSVFLLIVGAGLNTCSSYVSSQDIVQRFTTTTDMKKLNKMMLTNGALSIFIATVFYLIGTGLYVFYSQNALPPAAQQDQIFASYIAYELPVGITGLLLAAIYAASQSTLSTGLNSVATSWTLDIQERLSKKEMSFALQTKSHSMYPWAWALWPFWCPWYWQTAKSSQLMSGSTDSWDWCWAYWAVHLPWVHSQRWPMQRALTWHSLWQRLPWSASSTWLLRALYPSGPIPSSPSPSHW